MKGWDDVTPDTEDEKLPGVEADYGICLKQINKCADMTSEILGTKGIKAFDLQEPEYDCILELKDEISEPALINLITGACMINYMLSTGGADAFWPALLDSVHKKDYDVEAPFGAYKTLKFFLNNYKVNNRINNARNKRLDKWYESGYSEWILEHYKRDNPIKTWIALSKSVESDMYKKTIMVAIKQLDIASLAYTGNYLSFPYGRVPLPIDLQIRKIFGMGGMIPPSEEQKVNKSARLAGHKFVERLDENLDLTTTSFRLDSLLFQAGREVFWTNSRQENIESLSDYFRSVASNLEDDADALAGIFTSAQSNIINFEFDQDSVDEFDEKKEFEQFTKKYKDINLRSR